MVSVLAFYSDDQSSNPAESFQVFSVKFCLKRTKMNKKRPGLAHFLKNKKDRESERESEKENKQRERELRKCFCHHREKYFLRIKLSYRMAQLRGRFFSMRSIHCGNCGDKN